MVFLGQLGLMTLGTLGVLFIKAVLRSRHDGDAFDFVLFLTENTQRLLLTGFGILVIGSLLFFDAGSVQSLLALLGPEIQLVAGATAGVFIAGLVLVVPKKEGG